MPPEPPTTLRFERKYVVTGAAASQSAIAMLLRIHPALFSELYHERWVNSVYFDTVDHRHYSDSEAGLSDRQKVRIRWYGAVSDPVLKPVLEVKVKHNALGRKSRCPLGDASLEELLGPDRALGQVQGSRWPPAARLVLHGLRPSLLNRYRRRYYLSACGRFRVTADTDLEFSDPLAGVRMGLTRLVIPATAIVELKYAVEHDTMAREVSNRFPFRVDRNCKYLVGRQCLRA